MALGYLNFFHSFEKSLYLHHIHKCFAYKLKYPILFFHNRRPCSEKFLCEFGYHLFVEHLWGHHYDYFMEEVICCYYSPIFGIMLSREQHGSRVSIISVVASAVQSPHVLGPSLETTLILENTYQSIF